MTIHQNAFFIGERVEWDGADFRPAGTGTISEIYIGTSDRLCYRAERDEMARGRWFELLEEREIRRVEGVGG